MADRFAAGSLPALQFSRFSARGSMASPCGSSHGPLLATKCNKSDNSTWQMPAQKITENNRWEAQSRFFTDLHTLWTASGIWRRDTSSKQYELHLESRRRAESSGNTGRQQEGGTLRGVRICERYPLLRLQSSPIIALACSRPHGRRRCHSFEPGSL